MNFLSLPGYTEDRLTPRAIMSCHRPDFDVNFILMRILTPILAVLLMVNFACAATVILKSGDKIEGTVTETNENYVNVNFKGADITYRTFEIETIDGKPVAIAKKFEPDSSLGFMLESQGVKKGPESINVVTAGDYLKRGLTYYGKDNLDQAIADLSRAINANPELTEAYLYRGLTYIKKNEPDKAIADYDKAIELNPKNEEAYYVRGVVYAGKKDIGRALDDYNKAIELNPKYVQAYLNRSIINLMKGNPEQVIADMIKVIEVNPKVPAAYYIKGAAYANENNMQQAIVDYSEAIKLKPDYVEVYVDRALAYAYKDKIAQAKIDPNSPAAYINIGINKLSKADYDQAIADCSKAIEIATKYANAYIVRARIYILGNDFDKAWLDVHKVEELGGTVNSELLEDLKKASGREK
ncbi:MAG: tetratricopeptide repeat protein [Candidatus Omnitrophica bacterium]|nr:tetratricopeptide repeat protein [Candidatus Omnitrophota bacterium]